MEEDDVGCAAAAGAERRARDDRRDSRVAVAVGRDLRNAPPAVAFVLLGKGLARDGGRAVRKRTCEGDLLTGRHGRREKRTAIATIAFIVDAEGDRVAEREDL